MGHKWAQNVPDHIGGGTLATLAARILPFELFVTNEPTGDPLFASAYLLPAPGTDLPYSNFPIGKVDPSLNFPYGLDVMADGPT